MTASSDDLPSLWAEQWAIQVAVETTQLRRRVDIARSEPLDNRQSATADAIYCLLDLADHATRRDRRRRRVTATGRLVRQRRGISDRWRGTSVEKAYQSLHAARVLLTDLLPENEVWSAVPAAVARARAVLDRDDPRRDQVEQLMSALSHRDRLPPADRHLCKLNRADLKQVMDIAYDAADQVHVRVRDFRNVLLVAALLISVLMTALVALVSRWPEAMPLCFNPSSSTSAPASVPQPTASGPSASVSTTPTPAVTSPAPTSAPTPPASAIPTSGGTTTSTPGQTAANANAQVCPSSDRGGPSGADIIIVVGLGLLGGALAAAFAIRNIRGTSSPYDIPIALALLKVPSGSLTALAGILLLGGGFVPGLSQLDTQRQILAYALVFGYAQQLATRFIDDRAQSLLNSVPSKEASPVQPSSPVPQPHYPPGQGTGVVPSSVTTAAPTAATEADASGRPARKPTSPPGGSGIFRRLRGRRSAGRGRPGS